MLPNGSSKMPHQVFISETEWLLLFFCQTGRRQVLNHHCFHLRLRIRPWNYRLLDFPFPTMPIQCHSFIFLVQKKFVAENNPRFILLTKLLRSYLAIAEKTPREPHRESRIIFYSKTRPSSELASVFPRNPFSSSGKAAFLKSFWGSPVSIFEFFEVLILFLWPFRGLEISKLL